MARIILTIWNDYCHRNYHYHHKNHYYYYYSIPAMVGIWFSRDDGCHTDIRCVGPMLETGGEGREGHSRLQTRRREEGGGGFREEE